MNWYHQCFDSFSSLRFDERVVFHVWLYISKLLIVSRYYYEAALRFSERIFCSNFIIVSRYYSRQSNVDVIFLPGIMFLDAIFSLVIQIPVTKNRNFLVIHLLRLCVSLGDNVFHLKDKYWEYISPSLELVFRLL